MIVTRRKYVMYSKQDMEDDQKNVLQKHYKIIVDSVQYHNVVPRLVSEGILTTHDAERIKAGETSQDQMIR